MSVGLSGECAAELLLLSKYVGPAEITTGLVVGVDSLAVVLGATTVASTAAAAVVVESVVVSVVVSVDAANSLSAGSLSANSLSCRCPSAVLSAEEHDRHTNSIME